MCLCNKINKIYADLQANNKLKANAKEKSALTYGMVKLKPVKEPKYRK